MLTGLLAFRSAVPDEVADAFVPEMEAQRAAHELATMDERTPEIRSHILHANWHVPLRWFGAFDDGERTLIEDKGGLRLRYETSTRKARTRLHHTLTVLESAHIDDSITEAVRELIDWLSDFSDSGLVELDYGTVAQMFGDEELLDDRSAGEVQNCVRALEQGNVSQAGLLFATLSERWTGARACEILN